MILHRIATVLFILVLAGLLVWIGQSISGNFARQALIEEEDYGALRKDLDEDFSGREIETAAGTVLLYEYSKKNDPEKVIYDQASDHTLANAKTGKTLRIAGNDRRVIRFMLVQRPVPPDPAEKDAAPRRQAYAYVAQLATRQMYKDGVSDLVVGNLETLEQKQIASGVRFVDNVDEGPDAGQVSILYWDSDKSARHVLVSSNTLEVLRSTPIPLPELRTFQLDLEMDRQIERDEALDRADPEGRGRPDRTLRVSP